MSNKTCLNTAQNNHVISGKGETMYKKTLFILAVALSVSLFAIVTPVKGALCHIPDVVGKSQEAAEFIIETYGLSVGAVSFANSDTVDFGYVADQDPDGYEWVECNYIGDNKYDVEVDLVISLGPQSPDEPEPQVPPPSPPPPSPSPPPSPPPVGGLVAHWKLDEVSGITAYDSSGNGYDGILYGKPVWQPEGGRIDGALLFDGVDDHVFCGNFNPSQATGQISVTLWAKWSGLTGQWQGLIGKRDSWNPNDMMWQIEADPQTGALGFYHAGSGRYYGDPVLPIDEWAHIAATFDGAVCTLYFNGRETGSASFTFGSDTDADVVFGASEQYGSNTFNGALDDVRIYDFALKAAEVEDMAGTGGVAEAGWIISGQNMYSDVLGNLGIGTSLPTEKLDVAGTARLRKISPGSGAIAVVDMDGKLWKQSSSRRYKTNINDLELYPDKVLQLRPVRFQWKTTGQAEIGLIAEEVEEVSKDLVIYDKEGRPDSVKYDKLALYFLSVLKAQQEKIEALEMLKTQNEALERRIQDLERKINRQAYMK
jgi:hypothetical protein